MVHSVLITFIVLSNSDYSSTSADSVDQSSADSVDAVETGSHRTKQRGTRQRLLLCLPPVGSEGTACRSPWVGAS